MPFFLVLYQADINSDFSGVSQIMTGLIIVVRDSNGAGKVAAGAGADNAQGGLLLDGFLHNPISNFMNSAVAANRNQALIAFFGGGFGQFYGVSFAFGKLEIERSIRLFSADC